ncbi:LOW QUALITY PROTEIN: leukocyte receptor cluster member 1 homolog [Haliotis rubra]|uniref:LOW QUALITY PROTEIN: leukocyte receptor cluster member 1 homolog n=1 Tax=Haliotis rubra TaxID=36100 RepID=UPI001EE52BAB|nr:LOW QUALITY PROTEIN: leukocyte receptor cluster member 1 homolog [Haliotis rubra]
MNILPHKSWHVRTKKNIERVRKDEEKAAEEEKERLRKIALAEQEARTDLLRKRAKSRIEHAPSDQIEDGPVAGAGELQGGEEAESTAVLEAESTAVLGADHQPRHINFFKEIEDGMKKHGKNADHEAEKKAEKEKWEKSIGLLTYLGQSAVETQESSPWYLVPQKRKRKKDDEEEEEEEEKKFDLKSMKERKRQEHLDPMNKMKEYVHKKKHKHHKEKKHKHHSKVKDHHSRVKDSKVKDHKHKKGSSQGSSSKTMEQLRAARLRREGDERKKTQMLMARLRGDAPAEPVEEPVGDRQRKYNSQYNPESVRQPKKKFRPSDVYV